MYLFETYQTVPMVVLSDLDPYQVVHDKGKEFPLFGDDVTFVRLDLSRVLIKNPAATFFIQLTETTMIEEGIFLGDLLVVDRSAKVRDQSLVIVYLDGIFTLRRIRLLGKRVVLEAANAEYVPVEVEPDMEFGVWGLVQDVIHGVG